MPSAYSIDTQKFSLQQLKDLIREKELLPGRVALKDDIDNQFSRLEAVNILSLGDLQNACKTKTKMQALAQKTGLALDYLILLRREANSYIPTPVKLSLLCAEEKKMLQVLARQGIEDSKQFFDRAATRSARKQLTAECSLSSKQTQALATLCDLIRMPGVGPVFAQMLAAAGICSVQQFLETDDSEILNQWKIFKTKQSQIKVNLSLKDIRYCRALSQTLPLILEL